LAGEGQVIHGFPIDPQPVPPVRVRVGAHREGDPKVQSLEIEKVEQASDLVEKLDQLMKKIEKLDRELQELKEKNK
jgi:TolA-binding protein